MMIDLVSWEIGYDDGLYGRASQSAGCHPFSYSSGYCQGRAQTQKGPILGNSRPTTIEAIRQRARTSRLVFL
jgi:hypothetical protein